MMQEQHGYLIEDDVLTIILPSRVGYSISNKFSKIFEISKEVKIRLIILDFKSTNFITSAGLVYLLLIVLLIKNKYNRNVLLQISSIKENLIRFCMSFGFFSKLSNHIGLTESQKILDQESKILALNELSLKSVIFPITSIEYNPDKSFFEDYTKRFINKFRDFFLTLTQFPVFNYSNDLDDFQEMFEASHETIKNIYDHSHSLGFGSIHASFAAKGTTITFSDIGIGIAASVQKKMPGLSEIEAIEWALKDGNSSKINGRNQGHGFEVLKEFCNLKNGILTLRTTFYQFMYSNKKWKTDIVPFFPGSQIIIYNPIIER